MRQWRFNNPHTNAVFIAWPFSTRSRVIHDCHSVICLWSRFMTVSSYCSPNSPVFSCFLLICVILLFLTSSRGSFSQFSSSLIHPKLSIYFSTQVSRFCSFFCPKLIMSAHDAKFHYSIRFCPKFLAFPSGHHPMVERPDKFEMAI